MKSGYILALYPCKITNLGDYYIFQSYSYAVLIFYRN